MADTLPIAALDLSIMLQAREKLDRSIVDHYAERLAAGDTFPPISVYKVGKKQLVVVDGYQRVYAHQSLQAETIEAEVTIGTMVEARMAAARANATHGAQRKPADVRKAIDMVLDCKTLKSDREIAAHVGCSPHTVAEVRAAREGRESPRATREEARAARAPEPPKAADAINRLLAGGNDDDEDDDQSGSEADEVDLESMRAPYQSIRQHVQAVRKSIDQLCESPRTGGYLIRQQTRMVKLCTDLIVMVNQYEPIEVCDDCGGSGCAGCLTTGFLPRATTQRQRAV